MGTLIPPLPPPPPPLPLQRWWSNDPAPVDKCINGADKNELFGFNFSKGPTKIRGCGCQSSLGKGGGEGEGVDKKWNIP